jgi:hypothetical protein
MKLQKRSEKSKTPSVSTLTNSSPDSALSKSKNESNTENVVTSEPVLILASQLNALNLQNNEEVSISSTAASHGSSIPTVSTIETRETDAETQG